MKNYFRCRSSGTQVLLALVLFTAGGCLVVKAALFRPEATNTGSQKTLTFDDRVAYQRAVEEVYWRHRIWPKENRRRKPPLDQVMSQEQIDKKVEEYLRNSQLLADQWQEPVTAGQLQAELERMASHTRQPEVLRELFAALGNDPFVIAECLARPVLSERLVGVLHVGSKRPAETESLGSWADRTEMDPSVTTDQPGSGYYLPEMASSPVQDSAGGCVEDNWNATSTASAPTARNQHTAVWTGSEMIVWGGFNNNGYLNTGGRYNPSTDSWVATSTTGAPTARVGHTAVWTGSEVIVWGGFNNGVFLNDGGRYQPSTDSWVATATIGAPPARYDHTAVWTGSEMIVWGGYFSGHHYLNTGGRYTPSTDSWIATTTTNAPTGRELHTAVWTGNEMIAWGGTNGPSYLNTGGKYNPSTDSWVATTTTDAPNVRWYHTAVWTGSEMIVWGGHNLDGDLITGGRYNPSTDSWVATTFTGAPAARAIHTAVWAGSEMIVWGGQNASSWINTGGRYNPSTDSWIATANTGAPTARDFHTAVWTGTEMIIWGGFNDTVYLNTGGRYCPAYSTPVVLNAVSRKIHGSSGTFDITLPLSGTPGIECRTGEGTSDYTFVITFNANVSVNGSPQAAVTSGTGIVGSGGVSNGGVVTIAGNQVTVPLTNVGNAQTMNVTLFAVNGSTNVEIPMSVLIGDTTGNGAVNAGDVSQSKSRIGQGVDETNFRSDVNANGNINATDVSIVKSHVGTGLP